MLEVNRTEEGHVSAEAAYVRGIDKQLGYLATWLPTTDIRVGDIGRFDGPTFVPTSSLSARGFKFKIYRDKDKGDMKAQVGRKMTLTAKLAGDAMKLAPSIPKAKAGVLISFSEDNSAALSLAGCIEDRIEDQEVLRDRILDLYDRYEWDKDLVVVTHVVRARKATVLVSEKGGANFALTASASAKLAGGVELGKLATGFTMASEYNSAYSFVSRSNLTPLFRAFRVTGFWPRVTEAHPRGFDWLFRLQAMESTRTTLEPKLREKAKLEEVRASQLVK